MTKTAAQQQIEALRRLREGAPVPEAGARTRRGAGNLTPSPATRDALKRRLEVPGEFRDAGDLAEVAARLLLAFPDGAFRADARDRWLSLVKVWAQSQKGGLG